MANVFGRQVVVPLVNKSGGAVAAGDVLIVDTSNDGAFTTTTSGAFTGTIGVAQETIASNATGRVLTAGYAALVNVNASVTRGQYGKTHTVVKQATGTSVRGVGTFCQWLTGGTTPTAMVYPPDLNASAGNVATDAIWDAAGDLAVGSGADTAAKLAKGSAGAVLAMLNGALAWNAGTSFPVSPATNDRYWRTDLGMGFYYDGSRWVSTTLHHLVATLDGGSATSGYLGPSVTAGDIILAAVPGLVGGSDIWLNNLTTQFFVSGGTALGASHKWVGIFGKRPTNNSITTLITVTIDSGSSSVWRTDTQAIGALLNNGTTHFVFGWGVTKTGTPGPLYAVLDLTYRLVAV